MKFFSIIIVAVLMASCGTVTRLDQTCITCVSSQRIACQGPECPASFMNGASCLVTMVETGENIYLNDILKEEKITPRDGIRITLAKVNGRYYVAGESFTKVWYLIPRKKNEACLKSVEMPAANMGVVTFEVFDNQLKMISENKEMEFLFDDDDNEWHNAKSAKIGG